MLFIPHLCIPFLFYTSMLPVFCCGHPTFSVYWSPLWSFYCITNFHQGAAPVLPKVQSYRIPIVGVHNQLPLQRAFHQGLFIRPPAVNAHLPKLQMESELSKMNNEAFPWLGVSGSTLGYDSVHGLPFPERVYLSTLTFWPYSLRAAQPLALA